MFVGIYNKLYIIMFLHQTTTFIISCITSLSCILSCSYIKPQPLRDRSVLTCVVYYHVPTSNHNYVSNNALLPEVVYYHVPTSNHNASAKGGGNSSLYIIMFLHQTTTVERMKQAGLKLYIIMFLHQTTTNTAHLRI